jgi:hypothetical protein
LKSATLPSLSVLECRIVVQVWESLSVLECRIVVQVWENLSVLECRIVVQDLKDVNYTYMYTYMS